MTERIVGEARAMDGIRGGYWLRSADSGDLLAVTLWDTEEAMQATEQQAASLREEASQQAGGGQITVERCEVIGQL